jgi:phosphoserine phosphatase RsbU/P
MTEPCLPEPQAYAQQLKELAESLRYAGTIQQALFPQQTEIQYWFPEHFLVFLPCQAVSGDFYFVSGDRNQVWLAVGDCTGHGVPGALLSILGMTILNTLVSRTSILSPAHILNRMREHIMHALGQTGSLKEQRDGLDLTLCRIDFREHLLEYAGAFNPLYLVRNACLQVFPGDPMPVGIGSEQERSFSATRVQLVEGDMLYVFSDGFADQFGGPHGKKFKYKAFRNLITSVAALPVPEQKIRAEAIFLEWKGENRQTDDVTLFGFRYRERTPINLIPNENQRLPD